MVVPGGTGISRSLPLPPGAQRALAALAALGAMFGVVAEVQQGIAMGIGDEVHRAAGSAVAAIGPAAGHELLAAEAQAAGAAVPRLHDDFYVVNEHVDRLCAKPRPKTRGDRVPGAAPSEAIPV